MSPSPR